MKKLESLSEEQIIKMDEVKNYWLDYIFSCKNQINKQAAKIGIDWMYNSCKYKSPIIIYVESPLGCQYAVALLKYVLKNKANVGANVRANVGANVGANVRANVGDNVWDNVWDNVGANVGANVWANVRANVGANVWDNVWDNVGANVRANVRDNVWDNVWDNVGANVGANVWDNVWDNVWANVGANVWDNVWANVRDNVGDNFEQFGSYGSISDYGWVSFYDFFTQIGVINHEKFNQFKSLIQSGIYDTIQLQGFCIVSNLPDKIKRNRFGRLHCEDGSAIHFRDTYELFYWNGVNVPQNWIMNKDSITKDVIMKESNAEKRRVLREILGAKKYYDIITDGNGLNLLDEDQDNQGNIMRLYETKVPDSVLNKNVQFLECVCPSTLRVYNIYPPSQNTKNVWEAKANTFGKTQNEFNPVFES